MSLAKQMSWFVVVAAWFITIFGDALEWLQLFVVLWDSWENSTLIPLVKIPSYSVHQELYDVGPLLTLPNITICLPVNDASLRHSSTKQYTFLKNIYIYLIWFILHWPLACQIGPFPAPCAWGCPVPQWNSIFHTMELRLEGVLRCT